MGLGNKKSVAITCDNIKVAGGSISRSNIFDYRKPTVKRLMFFISPTLVLLFSFSTSKPELITGKWKAVDFGGCTNFTAQDIFILSISSGYKYELTKNNNLESWREKGMIKIDTVNSQPTLQLMNSKCRYNDTLYFDYGSHGYPIIQLSYDSLIIKYNVCCYQDTCDWTSGTVKFVKLK